ncbi:ABC transporter C family member 13 [Penicillium subrubescens]|uniref:ABC transporter C family member 13 n=1 Tax=Penicillium subrubescens TaxID=1316194 RepID=A0A1Q5UMZ5_9EURO|nr:ABC transporter C family member 13 [Penicillium subrubescens]
MANFDRLQNFLKQPSARDPRHISQFRKANEAASIEGVSINFPSARDSVLRDVSLHLVRGEIVICAGAVGSGKSTLATAVLGGIAPVTGSISVCSQEVAYCAQDPWLSRATIREAIIGQREFQDKEWYTTVIEACGLLPDFATFVDGDLTVIDNNGMNLSGGQKQRIASGIVTIRAFGWQSKFEQENIKFLDISQKPSYLLLCLQCWLKVTLDSIMAIFAVILIVVTVLQRDTTSGSDLGLALNLIILANTTLLKLVQSWTSLETSLGTISRLKSVQDAVPIEDSVGSIPAKTDLHWPSRGCLKVDNISVAYSDRSADALSHLSIAVNPGQKIIVAGRTGSGKSTMMFSLLQMLQPRLGTIQIDDVDIGHLHPRIVRSQGIIAVPQDGFMIPTATLRFNLDPYHTCSNEDILRSLQRVGIWDQIDSRTDPSPRSEKVRNADLQTLLDLPMSRFLPFSAGQAQLFALGRMLLRIRSAVPRKPVVILDEASSSMDPQTESVLANILRHDLCDHTVVMIAHRVEGIISAMRPGVDAIATLQDGKLKNLSLL